MNMKIEKLNDNQIRCTLTKEDLVSRQLKISELAYGTEKAKRLFQEMMQQANYEFGFEAEDIPLMIEAIPMNAECVVLVITKVEDPEELDTRFARFSPSPQEADEDMDLESADELFQMLPGVSGRENAQKASPLPSLPATRSFRFDSLSQVMGAARVTGGISSCPSTLYKDSHSGGYLLTIHLGDAARDQFDRVCNILSEYGAYQRSAATSSNYYAEHYEVLIASDALQSLCVTS